MARNLRLEDPMQALPLVGEAILPPAGVDAVVVFGSEAMAGLYGWRVGTTAVLPLGPSGQQSVWVAGLYRDYGRQHGSVVLREVDYERLTGDRSRSGLSIWLQPGADPAAITQAVSAALPELGVLKWITATDVRALSLRIFDRSFAMTYVLEAAALCVALLSVAAAWQASCCCAGASSPCWHNWVCLGRSASSGVLGGGLAAGAGRGLGQCDGLAHEPGAHTQGESGVVSLDDDHHSGCHAVGSALGRLAPAGCGHRPLAARQGLDEKHLSSSLRADW